MIKIDDSHPIFTMADMVENATAAFLKKFGIHYFQYLRCYYDGAFSLLSNELGLLRLFEQYEDEPLIYSTFDENVKNKQQFFFFWDESLPTTPVTMAREKFNLNHGMTIVRREKKHYDMIAFALDRPHANPYGLYMTILPQLEWFICQFEKNQAKEISTIEQERIYLPVVNQDVNCKNLCLKTGRVDFEVMGKSTHITLKELNCIRALAKGYSYKEVANGLSISPKTVETYLVRVKNRTGLDYRSPLFLSL
jgi:DNA-binding CsgD family transcriptional regulator